jgi:Fe-S-cluster-containing hydrogenase component 2
LDGQKTDLLFFSPERCTGCKSCEMVCSLHLTGDECKREAAAIRISTYPHLSSFVVSVSLDCNCPDGLEKCVDICPQGAIIFVKKIESPSRLKDRDWLPSPILSSPHER